MNITKEAFNNCFEQGYLTIDNFLEAYYLISKHEIDIALKKYAEENEN